MEYYWISYEDFIFSLETPMAKFGIVFPPKTGEIKL